MYDKALRLFSSHANCRLNQGSYGPCLNPVYVTYTYNGFSKFFRFAIAFLVFPKIDFFDIAEKSQPHRPKRPSKHP